LDPYVAYLFVELIVHINAYQQRTVTLINQTCYN